MRTVALLFVAAIITVTGVSAQTRAASTRPKIQTNDSSEYRYAFQHGYKPGYEDGYVKGKSDFNENRTYEFENSEAYKTADRNYNTSLGTRAEYQEGYRIGFELGSSDGYYGRPYSLRMPDNLGRIVVATINNQTPANPPQEVASRPAPSDPPPAREERHRRREIDVPADVEMKVRLQTQISTKTNQEGDKFTVVVLDPSNYADATIDGHIAKLTKSGKATGKTELTLAFDTITFRDGKSGDMAAQVIKVYQNDSVKTVDEEGNVQSGGRGKDTATRAAGVGALGAIIGGIAGGGKGAVLGAIIGAGVGGGSVLVQDGKQLILDPGTEMLIRTAGPK